MQDHLAPDMESLTDGEQAMLRLMMQMRGRCLACVDLAVVLLHIQRFPDDRLKEFAYPAGPSPLVAVAFLSTEMAQMIGAEASELFNRAALQEFGQQHPKKGFFSSDTAVYLDRYDEFKRCKALFPDSYHRQIESTLKSSMFYPYRGQIRPMFQKGGLLREVEWLVKEVVDHRTDPQTLMAYYMGLHVPLIGFRYPHDAGSV